MTRNPNLIDVVLTDCRKTVLHGQISQDALDYLTSESLGEPAWSGRLTIHNVCQVINWRNKNGFTGLLALGPVANEEGSCLLGVRAPRMTINAADLTSVSHLTLEAQSEFWGWSRA